MSLDALIVQIVLVAGSKRSETLRPLPMLPLTSGFGLSVVVSGFPMVFGLIMFFLVNSFWGYCGNQWLVSLSLKRVYSRDGDRAIAILEPQGKNFCI